MLIGLANVLVPGKGLKAGPFVSESELLATVDAGMVPKLEACIRAVRGGVPQAHVVDGRQPHSLLLEVFTDEGIGTMVIPDEPGLVRA